MERQLRVYRLDPDRIDEFIAVWRDQIVPARLAAGFSVEGAWLSRPDAGFAWVLAYYGPKTFAEASKDYYESPVRKRIRPDPGELVLESDTSMVERLA